MSSSTENTGASQEFYYHLRWRALGVHAGAHKTQRRGTGSDFCGYTSFLDYPDPRRLDVRAGLRMVPKQKVVRTFYERGAVNVFAVVDLSSSMRFYGNTKKTALVEEVVAAIAWSANRSGDAFGLLACNEYVHHDLSMLPSYRRGCAEEARGLLQAFYKRPQIENTNTHTASALPLSANEISSKRVLVFLISDFHLPNDLIKSTLQAYSIHDVVPIVLWDSAENENLPKWGWTHVRDMETGGLKSLFLRKSLHQNIQQGYQQRRQDLIKLCHQYGVRRPFFIQDKFEPEQLSRHLLEGVS